LPRKTKIIGVDKATAPTRQHHTLESKGSKETKDQYYEKCRTKQHCNEREGSPPHPMLKK
jgi:hypothetical protein